MFMFWSKRAVLTRRLLKAKVRGEHETECETQEDTFTRINVPNCSNNGSTTSGGIKYKNAQQVTTTQHHQQQQQQQQQQQEFQRETRAQQRSASSVTNRGNSVANRFHQGCCGGDLSHDDDDTIEQNRNRQQRNQPNRLTRCKELLKSLKDNQLEMLLNVVESYGADFGSCVLVPRNKYNISPCRLSSVNKQNSPPSSPIISPKKQQQQQQQQESMVQCNRHQRCGLASSLHENPTRRIPHRHLLRSRRNHGGSRCSRCVSCHGEEQRSVTTNVQRDELSCSTDNDIIETRDNEMNLRVVDSNNVNSGDLILEDLRQEQPAWSGGDTSNFGTMGVGQQSGETCGSRPERDRCRRSYGKISRTSTTTTATTGTRKRRDSSPSGEQSSSDSSFDGALDDPHLLSCQIWRWPDLVNSSELKKLPVCHSAKDPVYTCCNPYHWSRLCKPESPPPPYCLIPDRLRPEDRAPSESSADYRRCGVTTSLPPHSGSLTTNGEGGDMGQKEWCTLAYWELGGRVGRLYPVEPSTVNVFDSLHDGDGLCLATLSENHPSSPAVQRTRSKIGLGLMLSQETDGVWAYNRSDSPIFVNSPTLDDPESRTLLVYRVPPGFCLNIFDRAKTMQLPRSLSHQNSPTSASFNSGPVDVNSVRISFAKGWGPKYSRQEVTSCPCWLEVLLAPCR